MNRVLYFEHGDYYLRCTKGKGTQWRWYFTATLKGDAKPSMGFGSNALTLWGAKREAVRRLP
jgi:hypothetical protein